MSNLSGNYKISTGEVQGVDVAREQERRARLQLLDEIREPSPQPIFGEPVKVELEDETSRRIKNTLGDFTQVLTNDSKSLLGIARTSSSTPGQHGVPPSGGRVQQPAVKRPPNVNGMYKPSPTNIPKHPAPDKRPMYPNPRNKPHEPPNVCPPSSSMYNADNRLKDQTQWQNPHHLLSQQQYQQHYLQQPQQRKPGAPPPVLNGSSQNSQNVPFIPNYNRSNPSFCPNSSNSVPSNKSNPFHVPNGWVSNTVSHAPRYGESSSSSSAPPAKRNVFRPSNLKLPERKTEQPAESPIELETILREMKQAVPPPLTAIQTPRTEECGFAFPEEPKEDAILTKVKELNIIKTSEPMPQSLELPKLKDNKSCQSTSSPCITTQLQDDLDLSESDDEPVITDVKLAPVQTPKSPVTTSNVIPNNASTAVSTSSTMEIPQVVVPSNSSDSSDSGDSDSEDSSSECDSDSSASSEASDADTPSKMWGLRNFIDESRRNHSPAFVPLDTSTNSSIAAVREEPMIISTVARENYSLVDEDLGNGLQEYPNHLKEYLNVSVAAPIPSFLDLNPPVTIKNEILSPITSPLQPPSSHLSQPPTVRGPRTPPLPPTKDESIEVKTGCSASDNIKKGTPVTIEMTVPQSIPSHLSKNSNMLQNSCDNKEDMGKVLIITKKPRFSKNKSDVNSPRKESSPVKQCFQDDEVSASKGQYKTSVDKDDKASGTVLTTSCSVPSKSSESFHESVKIRQKVSKSSNSKNINKNQYKDSLSESGQKGNCSFKSPKFKHPARTCRASTETKQSSKISKSTLKQSDQTSLIKQSVNKTAPKEKISTETKLTSKTTVKNKNNPKSSVKINKLQQSPKQNTTKSKKGDKKKKNKFHIGNFLQSPTISQSETGQLSKLSTICSPSLNKSPVPDNKNCVDGKRKSSVSSACASQTQNKSSGKSVEKVKSGGKLRRSARCSERASNTAQAESSTALQQDSDLTKKSVKRTLKPQERSGSPKPMETPPLLLPPIPLTSPFPSTSFKRAIPAQILVSIPLDKLSRHPIFKHILGLENTKNKSQSTEERLQKKDISLSEKSTKSSKKRSLSKDTKAKSRTDADCTNKKIKLSAESKKDKSKSKDNSSLKLKITSTVNIKSSIKSMNEKSSSNATEVKSAKKHQIEEDKSVPKKKPKVAPESNQEKIQPTSLTSEAPSNQTDSSSKSKGLERCDSVSSLSSISSLVGQKSSKTKKSLSTTLVDAKRGKLPVTVKHIKQEKEEIIKTTIKKEPGTPDKKEKCRDKIFSEESDPKPLTEPLWNDASSQYGILHTPWDGLCKDDPKGTLAIITRTCGINWDFPEMSKEMKESSNKHNNPIMPMDYYYTEGRKQRHLAETEKDPFLQTLKYFEATVLFILTSQQREEYTKEPESVYQFYRETLNFSNVIFQNVRIQLNSPGSTEFKILILLLRCQALLHVKLYNLKIKEIKEQQKNVSDFFLANCSATVKSLSHPTPPNPRLSLINVPSPHSPLPSPASSINSQTSGYSSSDVNGNHMRNSLSLHSQSINVTQSMLEMICRQHTHLINLHMGHDLWEQADMYMTRSNLRDFFKEVADLSENLTLHSSIKDLVNYIQTGISLVKKCSR